MDSYSIMDKLQLAFASLDKEATLSIPEITEVENRGKKYMYYGTDNLLPSYLYSLYTDVTTLRTIIIGTSDFVVGDNITTVYPRFALEVNKKGHTLMELIRWCTRDYLIYGGFAINVIRNKVGEVSELYYIDFRYIRSDKHNESFWYSEKFDKKWSHTTTTTVYPKYVRENTNVASSIFYYKNSISSTYPTPRYTGAIKACEIEKNIDELHLRGLQNGFFGSYVFNFNNGIPEDELKEQIEGDVQQKFCGSQNGGRVLINFSEGKDNALTIDKLDAVDFSEKYDAAAKRSREQIYASFQAVPALFGIMTESKGFTQEEFAEAFVLYNRTVVRSIQRIMCDALDKITGMKNSITIVPFSINNSETVN